MCNYKQMISLQQLMTQQHTVEDEKVHIFIPDYSYHNTTTVKSDKRKTKVMGTM